MESVAQSVWRESDCCWEICSILPLLSIKALLITVIYTTALHPLAFAGAVKTVMNFSHAQAKSPGYHRSKKKSPGYQKSIKSLSSTSHLNLCSLMGGSLARKWEFYHPHKQASLLCHPTNGIRCFATAKPRHHARIPFCAAVPFLFQSYPSLPFAMLLDARRSHGCHSVAQQAPSSFSSPSEPSSPSPCDHGTPSL
jgi:hypothetical protein